VTDQPKELAISEGSYNAQNMTIREMSFIANEMAQARMFPDITTAHTAFVKILAGREMGIGPFQALSGIHVIQGKAVLGGGLLAAAVKNSGRYDYKVLEQTDKVCRIQFLEGKTPIGTSEFTIEDAKKAGTKNLDKYPKNMLFNRAMSNGVKWYAPNVTSGPVYVEGEITDTAVEASQPEPPIYEDTWSSEQKDELKAIVNDKTETMDYVDEYPTEADLQTALDALTPNPISPKQRAFLFSLLTQAGVPASKAKGALYAIASHYLSREITKTEDISKEDAIGLIDFIQNQDAAALELFFGGEA
jgi:hypothetical protein